MLTVLLRLTGFPKEKANFQIISILTGTGFTTRESELMMKHDRRRKIAKTTMLLGYVGSATLFSFIVNIINASVNVVLIFVFIFLSVIMIYIFNNQYILNFLDNSIEKIAQRKIINTSKENIVSFLEDSQGYGVVSIIVDEKCKVLNKKLKEANLLKQGIQILSVDKGDKIIHNPDASYILEENDKLLIFGKLKAIGYIFKE